MTSSKLHAIKAVALAVSIVIVLNLFVNMGIDTFYPSPEFENFCADVEGKVLDTRDACEAVGGEWIVPGQAFEGGRYSPVPVTKEDAVEYCDAYAGCRDEYEVAREVYDRNVFIILVIAGLISLGIGYGISAAEAVSSGLVFGGVLSFIIGTMRYWSNMDEYLRFIILGIVLAILIWIGYSKLSRSRQQEM